jgi:GAF domain-containing protein
MLTPMKERLLRSSTPEQAMWTMLDDAIALQGAEFGNVQLLAGEELVIVAQRNFSIDFLTTFARVTNAEGCACGRALRSGVPTMITDVERDPEFAPFRPAARRAGFRAVQSTPCVTGRGRQLGVISTHFVNVHRPTEIEMETLQAYGRLAAEFVFGLLDETPLDVVAERLNDKIHRHVLGEPSRAQDSQVSR